MGHKIQPNSYRLGVTRNWSSRWFVKKGYQELLEEDIAVRKVIKNKIGSAGIDKIDIERNGNICRVYIKAAKPGLIIGRGGKGIEELAAAIKETLVKLFKKRKDKKSLPSVSLNIEEIKKDEISAAVVGQQIAWDIEKRLPYRRTMKRHLELMMQNRSVLGAKIRLAGRLDGNEIARDEWLAKGRLPLTTLRANIDYAEATAYCTYGTIGIKVWLYKGDNEL